MRVCAGNGEHPFWGRPHAGRLRGGSARCVHRVASGPRAWRCELRRRAVLAARRGFAGAVPGRGAIPFHSSCGCSAAFGVRREAALWIARPAHGTAPVGLRGSVCRAPEPKRCFALCSMTLARSRARLQLPRGFGVRRRSLRSRRFGRATRLSCTSRSVRVPQAKAVTPQTPSPHSRTLARHLQPRPLLRSTGIP